MPNNPVQIVLNDEDFLLAPDGRRPGPEKDFFEGADAAFAKHQKELLDQIDEAIAAIEGSDYGPAAYLRVQMREEALAKSYRPNRDLFRPDQFPCVGADAVGTIYFRAPLIYLGALRRRVEAAEATVATRVSRATGKTYFATSRARSEVGAIGSIVVAPAEDKRHFSSAAAVQAMRDPRAASGYQIELFETPTDKVIADDPLGRHALLRSLERVLTSMGQGTRALVSAQIGRTQVVELQLTTGTAAALVDNRLGLASRDASPLPERAPLDLSVERHDKALDALARHPLVRTIRSPILLELADAQDASPAAADDTFTIPSPSPDATYPIVGVIDTGIGPALGEWVVDRFDYLDIEEYNPSHGTGVAGLITVGQSANSPNVMPEPDGCRIYDAPLYPKGPFSNFYKNGFWDFLEEIERAVVEANENHGVRIFNLSINATSEVEPHRYSIYAARLDQISDTYGVVFVNSAGNLGLGESRSPWPESPRRALQYFASRTQLDTVMKPTESVRGISVGALNPPGTEHLEEAPTVYTRRGPGLQVGVKPDVAAYGGAGVREPGQATGLSSITPDGKLEPVRGTSYAAPPVARTMAGLDTSTQGVLGPEGLRAMLLHHTSTPAPLARQGMKDLSRQFAGFGRPCGAAAMLETGDHQITMVFESRLTKGERRPVVLQFPFQWPVSLTDDGACSGRVRMTLVYSPPLDPAFGAEFVRVNLDASLAQRQDYQRKDGKPSFTSQVKPRYLPKMDGLGVSERALIDHGLKWWPSKQYEQTLKRRGTSSSWRLEVTSLVRAEAEFPVEGVAFAVVLTIEDPSGSAPVFQEMQQSLQASRADMRSIQTAARLRPRGR